MNLLSNIDLMPGIVEDSLEMLECSAGSRTPQFFIRPEDHPLIMATFASEK